MAQTQTGPQGSMPDDETSTLWPPNQISTSDLAAMGAAAVPPLLPSMGAQPNSGGIRPDAGPEPAVGQPQAGPAPSGTRPGAAPGSHTAVSEDQTAGVGIEGEVVVWDGRYSWKNFFGRVVGCAVLVGAWIALAVYAWGFPHEGSLQAVLAVITGLVVLSLCLTLLYRLVWARVGHGYRLTNRRLFVTTGVMRRRRDMMELLKVQDVFMRQTLMQRWLSVGTVVVESSDAKLPRLFLTGVDDPKGVLDTVWHYARAERDRRTVRVDPV